METPEDLRYTEEHEWVRSEGSTLVIGITDYAQSELGDIVYVELPQADTEVKMGAIFGTIEAVKTVSDLYSPVSGRIVEVNETLKDLPETVNQEPYQTGWMIRVEPTDGSMPEKLMDAAGYRAHVGEDN